jgi:hypothetical protein
MRTWRSADLNYSACPLEGPETAKARWRETEREANNIIGFVRGFARHRALAASSSQGCDKPFFGFIGV